MSQTMSLKSVSQKLNIRTLKNDNDYYRSHQSHPKKALNAHLWHNHTSQKSHQSF